jgi:hypothetical protein
MLLLLLFALWRPSSEASTCTGGKEDGLLVDWWRPLPLLLLLLLLVLALLVLLE